jgi:hypothetical protein
MSIHECPECRREFEVLYPDLWAYKSGKGTNTRYICSWCCLRRYEKKGGDHVKKIFTDEQREAVFQAAVSGGNPIRLLEEYGAKNPTAQWTAFKKKWKAEAPEKYAALPEKYKPRAEQAPEMPTVKLDGPLKIETPEASHVQLTESSITISKDKIVAAVSSKPKITKPLTYSGLEVSAVRDPNLGEFYRDIDHNCIDWRNGVGDEVSLSISGWKIMVERLAKILQVLGVDA